MFNLIKSLQSWFAVDRPWAHLRPSIRALRTPPYDLAALAALEDELTRNHREMPLSLLWRIWRLAEKAQTRPGEAAATGSSTRSSGARLGKCKAVPCGGFETFRATGDFAQRKPSRWRPQRASQPRRLQAGRRTWICTVRPSSSNSLSIARTSSCRAGVGWGVYNVMKASPGRGF